MPVPLLRLRNALEGLRLPALPERPRLPHPLYAKGRLFGTIAFYAGVAVALVWANSPLASTYATLCDLPIVLRVDGAGLSLNLRSLINEGLMTLFFFSVGLAVRRQTAAITSGVGVGRYAPLAAAAGAMVLPALVLSLVAGAAGLKVALVAGGLDLGLAVAAYAVADGIPSGAGHRLFPFAATTNLAWMLSVTALGMRFLSVEALAVCVAVYVIASLGRWLGARGAVWALFSGGALWLAWRKTGFPPAMAGAVLATLIPIRCPTTGWSAAESAEDALDDYDRAMDDVDADRCSALARRLGDIALSAESPVDRWQRGVVPWLVLLALPLFGWANGGVVFGQSGLGSAFPWLVAVVLLVAKPLGAIGGGWLVFRRIPVDGDERRDWRPLAALAAVSPAVGLAGVAGAALTVADPSARASLIVVLSAVSLLAAGAAGLAIRLYNLDVAE